MAYVVGLMATDGCLISGRSVLNFKSQDEQLVRVFLSCLGRPLRYRTINGRTGRTHYVTQFGDAPFYRWLRTAGLMPRKSLVIGALAVPDDLLGHCARGLLDGDGSLIRYFYNCRGRTYEGFRTTFVSASGAHLEWLRERLAERFDVVGALRLESPVWRLRYAIRESILLLPRLYTTADVPKLQRKWKVWSDYAEAHGYSPTSAEYLGRPFSLRGADC